jgi:hypothetical protein
MPNTYTLIASNTLSTSAASVTFSSIPATFTDLVLKFSVRSTGGSNAFDHINVTFNGDTATNYSRTYLSGDGAAASSARSTSASLFGMLQASDGATATSNTFSNGDLYIPSYTASQNKPISQDSAQENNSTTAFRVANAGLWRNTAAITSITLAVGGSGGSTDFVSGSSFYLYGIKNS